MPVERHAAVKSGMGSIIDNISSMGLYGVLDNNTAVPFLCDIIPRPYPRPFVISPGDIVIVAGLFLLIMELMKVKKTFIRKGK